MCALFSCAVTTRLSTTVPLGIFLGKNWRKNTIPPACLCEARASQVGLRGVDVDGMAGAVHVPAHDDGFLLLQFLDKVRKGYGFGGMEGGKLRSRARGIHVVWRHAQWIWFPLVMSSRIFLMNPTPSTYLGPSRQVPPDTRAAASPPHCNGERLTCELQMPFFAMRGN